MRYLGIDYGTKRVGIAVSDEAGQFALPHDVLPNAIPVRGERDQALFEGLADSIAAIAREKGATELVLGESRDYSGAPNPILSDSLALKAALESRGFRVHMELEFMTSANAERFQGKTALTDASAAALILQSYLDKVQSR